MKILSPRKLKNKKVEKKILTKNNFNFAYSIKILYIKYIIYLKYYHFKMILKIKI